MRVECHPHPIYSGGREPGSRVKQRVKYERGHTQRLESCIIPISTPTGLVFPGGRATAQSTRQRPRAYPGKAWRSRGTKRRERADFQRDTEARPALEDELHARAE